MNRRALITGITGQDGSYLAELLLQQGYEVHGTLRPGPKPSIPVEEYLRQCRLHTIDLLDQDALAALLAEARPQEVYNLAAPSFVPESWQNPIEIAEVVGLAPVKLLEAIRKVDPQIRFCQAGSAEMFGASARPLGEQSPCSPRSPYGAAKAYAHWMIASYRRHHGLFAANAILFNHESPRRSPRFVTRKITLAAARIKLGFEQTLTLGDLTAQRDWGFAGDFVRAMWLMLQQPEPADYVIATGESHSVGEVVELAFGRVGLDWRQHVVFDAALARPADNGVRRGDIGKARRELGWQPSLNFEALIHRMVDADLKRVQRELQGSRRER